MTSRMLTPVLFVFFLSILSVTTFAADRYVSTSGTDSGDCTITSCLTIQYAIDQASSGDTVNVAAGTYNGQLTINKDNLKIQSTSGSTNTIIDLMQPTETTGIWITANNVIFKGFTVRNISTTSSHAQYAVRVHGSNNNITDNIIIGQPSRDWWNDEEDSGINLDGTTATVTANNLLENNEIYGFSAMGIQIVGSGGNYNSHDNIIKNNNIHNIDYYAIANDRSGNQIIQGNTLTNIGPSGHVADGYPATGIVAWGSQSTGTKINYQNLNGMERGVALSATQGVTIQNSEINNCGIGIQLSDSSWLPGVADNNVIQNNTIRNNNNEGIVVKSCGSGCGGIGTGNLIKNNNIFSNTNAGLHNYVSVQIIAENNWWGCQLGPGNTGCDSVSGTVDFNPWLCEPYPTTWVSVSGTCEAAPPPSPPGPGNSAPNVFMIDRKIDIGLDIDGSGASINPTNIRNSNYAFTGEQIFYNVLVRDDNGAADINQVSWTKDSSSQMGPCSEIKICNRYVDVAGTCEGNQPCYTKIQDAINAANDNDIVCISSGTYDEQVVITKSLILQGSGDTTIISPSSAAKLTDVYTYPAGFMYYSGVTISGIINVKNVVGAGVTIKNIKVDGTYVTSLPVGAQRLAGILYGESAGTITDVTVNSIKTTGYLDRTYGIDVSAAVNTVSVEISNSRITDFARNGIMGNGPKLTVNIHNNVITGPSIAIGPAQVPNGIVFMAELGGSARNNIIHSLHYNVANSWRSTGIMGFDTVQSGIVVENNEIYDVDDAINPSNNFIIRNNYLHGDGSGVVLEMGAVNNQILNNIIKDNTIDGIQLNGVLNSNPEGQDPSGAGNFAHNNDITGNTIGIVSYDNTQIFNAENNWWGCQLGPGNTGCDSVSGTVDFNPWLASKVEITILPFTPLSTSVHFLTATDISKGTNLKYDDQTDKIYQCILTVESQWSGNSQIKVSAKDTSSATGSTLPETWNFNPPLTVSLTTSDDQTLSFGAVQKDQSVPGATSPNCVMGITEDLTSRNCQLYNPDQPGQKLCDVSFSNNKIVFSNTGIVDLWPYIAATNFYDSDGMAKCPFSNELSANQFEYRVLQGSWDSGWRVMPQYSPDLGCSGITLNGQCRGGCRITEGSPIDILSPTQSSEVQLKIVWPTPCTGSFDTGSIFAIFKAV